MTAWRTVAKASSYTYQPGDSLLLRRGSHCDGMLWPKGSGNRKAPIRLGAYGQGALPIIVGGSESAGLRLSDQQYWEIENLEVVGGSPYGVHIGGTIPVMRHFRITNVVVHDVTGTPLTKDSGLVVIAPDDQARTEIDDVIVDGVTAYRTSEWAGIIVNGAGFDSPDGLSRGEHIEIRNSIVHDVAGDGFLIARVWHGVLEHNVAWYTGMQEKETIGTPNAIWEWRCRDCRVEYNEGFFTDSPGVDGGVFDIDYGDENNLLEHNFGHDSQGYCVSVFGAEGTSGNTIHSEVRQNTVVARIVLPANRLGKSPVKSAVDWQSLLSSHEPLNLTSARPDVADPNSASELDPVADKPDELCGCVDLMLHRAAGADQQPSAARSTIESHGRWMLYAVMTPPGQPGADASRGQFVLIESMMHQFAGLGLGSVVVPAHPMGQDELEQWRANWNFNPAIEIDATDASGVRNANNSKVAPLLLVSPSGRVAASWQFPVSPADVWLQIQSHLGTPAGAQQMPICESRVVR